MLHFLTDEHRASLLKLFETNSEAGRQLRQIFGSSQQTASRNVSYPPVFTRSSIEEKIPKPLCKRNVTVAYPKLAPKTTERTIQLKRPGKRPENVIKETMKSDGTNSNLSASKDLSQEKERLQEIFQFSSSKPLHGTPRIPHHPLIETALFDKLV